jgi:uncharacterized protein with WD repeat
VNGTYKNDRNHVRIGGRNITLGDYNVGSNAKAEQAANATGLSEKDKKVRNLEKKLRQIRELKERQLKGETLEPTQVRETAIRVFGARRPINIFS